MDSATLLTDDVRPEATADTSSPEEKSAVVKKARLIPAKEEGESKVNAAIDECFDRAFQARTLWDPWWTRYLAFTEGQQYIRPTRQGTLVPDNRIPTGKVRITVNLIKPTIQQMVAIMTTEKPMLKAAPSSQDTKDKNRAEVASQILRKVGLPSWLNFPLNDRLQKKWKAITGTCALLPEWNPDGGAMVKQITVDPATGQPIPKLDDDGEEIYAPAGDLDLLFFTSFEIYPDPGCNSEKDAEFVFLVSSMDPDEAERKYGVTKDGMTGEGKDGAGGPSKVSSLLARVFSMFGPSGGYLTQWGAVSNRGVDVLRLYVAPTAAEPSGRYILRVGGKIIHDEPSEMRGEFRFDPVFFRHDENGKRFFGNGVVELVLDLQIELNNAISQMAQQRKLNLNPKMMVPDTCQVQDEDWLASEGSILRFNSMDGEKPIPVEVPGIEPALFQILQVYQDMFDRIIGLNEPSRGEAVPKLSGKAVQLLQEANKSRLGVVVAQDYERWADVAERILWLAGKHYDPEQIKEIAGSNYAAMEADFFTTVLDKPVDVIVENDNALPQDRANRMSLVMQMAGQGGPLTMEGGLRSMVFRLLRFADVEGMLEEENLDDLRIRRMYEAIRVSGQAQMPAIYDDPLKCMKSLEILMKQEDFEKMGAAEPKKAEMVVALYQQYRMMMSGMPLPGPAGGQMPPGVVPPAGMVEGQVKAAGAPAPQGSPPAPKAPAQ